MADSTLHPSPFTKNPRRGRARLRFVALAIALGVLAAFVPLTAQDASALPSNPTAQAVADIQEGLERVPDCPLKDRLESIVTSQANPDPRVLDRIQLCIDSMEALAEKDAEVRDAAADHGDCESRTPGDCFAEKSHLDAVTHERDIYQRDVEINCHPSTIANGFKQT